MTRFLDSLINLLTHIGRRENLKVIFIMNRTGSISSSLQRITRSCCCCPKTLSTRFRPMICAQSFHKINWQLTAHFDRQLTLMKRETSAKRNIHTIDTIYNNTMDITSSLHFENVCNSTLDVLAEFLESLADEGVCHADFDVQLVSGVLTIKIGGDVGTYVINKQTPNQQIWLSSPLSGPKRYDLIDSKRWVYSHDGIELNELLSKEFSDIFKRKIYARELSYDPDKDDRI